MRISIATTSMGGPLVKRLEAASRAGFYGVEFFWKDCYDSGVRMRDIGNIARDLGLHVETLQPIRGFEGDKGSVREASEAAAIRLMEDALELGTDKVSICANEKAGASEIDDTVEELREIADRAETMGLSLGFEALSWSTQIRDLSQAWEVVKRANRGNLGVVIDSFHIGARGNDPQFIRTIPAGKIAVLQLSNLAVKATGSWLETSRHYRNLPDVGYFPVVDVLKTTIETGYNGSVTIEIFNDEMRKNDPFQVAQNCFNSVKRLLNQTNDYSKEVVIGADQNR